MADARGRALALADSHRLAGAVWGEAQDVVVPRHYGRPEDEYRAARTAVAVTDRSDRGRLVVGGRAPLRMLSGVITNSTPPAPLRTASGVLAGPGVYAAVLTPKGRMISDLRLFWLGETEAVGILLDVPAAGRPGLLGHFRKYLPPRFATVDDRSGTTCMLTVLGPGAAAAVSSVPGAGVHSAEEIAALAEEEYRIVGPGDGTSILVARTGDAGVPAYDLFVPAEDATTLWSHLRTAGCVALGRGVWETLRIEAGRPEYGIDMDEGTIPTEAGIDDRAIDHHKGCYTGQEVIVRIRDRGKVNWCLRSLRMGDEPTPRAGTELFEAGGERPLGRVTSAAVSPRMAEAIGLGYVRREVEPPAELRLAGPGGPPVRVVALGGREGDAPPVSG